MKKLLLILFLCSIIALPCAADNNETAKGNFTVEGNLTVDGIFTDGTTSITGGDYTDVGNITGSDVDIEAGTGSYNSTGTLGAGAITTSGIFTTSNGSILANATASGILTLGGTRGT